MEYWKTLLPYRVHDICCEDFVNDQRRATVNLLDACGLPWQDARLKFHSQSRTASDSQIRQPIHGSAVGRWKPYARHRREAADIPGISVV